MTIIHSATTETVRLPDDNNGVCANNEYMNSIKYWYTNRLINVCFVLFGLQVIVHTAIRTKVPLKKKVRGERSGKSKTGLASKSKSTAAKANTSAGLIQAATVATATTTQAFKRQGTALENAKKLAKKKKRTLTPSGGAEVVEPTPAVAKTKKPTKSKSPKHKEVIDYSKRGAANNQAHTNTFGKVQKWLLESPITPVQPTPAEVEHVSKVRQIMTKSQSTPERLALRTPKKSKSVDNMNDKVKLQVVYKPPFKFSLKLSKNSAVKTKVLNGAAGRSKRKSQMEKSAHGARDAVPKPRRTALLIRTTDEVDTPMASGHKSNCSEDQQQLMLSEPNYETLNPKVGGACYENANTISTSSSGNGLHGASKGDTINTATFRIKKSASGSNILGTISKYNGSSGSHSNTSTAAKTSSSGRGSSNNLNQIGTFGSYSTNSRGSTMNLSKQFGSSQNLIRSSNSNLTKSNSRNSFDIKRGFYDMSRSSTTNLSKDRRNGSHLNLLKHQHLRGSSSNVNSMDDITMPVSSGRTRRHSTTIKSNDGAVKSGGMSRAPSNSNLKMQQPQRRGSISNIPRASLTSSSFKRHGAPPSSSGNQPLFHRQTSQPSTSTSTGAASRMPRCPVSDQYTGRPHTADAKNNSVPFEWPALHYAAEKRSKNDGPSDMVDVMMVSDVENLVNDK